MKVLKGGIFMFKGIVVRSLLLACILGSFSLISNAVSLYDLQHSEQYKLLDSSDSNDFYMNLSSVQSLRYNPPYYTLKYQTYLINYNNSSITSADFIANYNYNQSIEGIVKSQNLLMLSSDEAKSYLKKAKFKDSGITGTYKLNKVYEFDGSVKVDFAILNNDNRYEKVEYSYANPLYIGAAYAFKKAYNIIF